MRKVFKSLTLIIFLLAFGYGARAQMPTITVTGSSSICPGLSATLSVANLNPGTTPWTIRYLDGTTTVTITGVLSFPHSFAVTPSVTTTYTLIDVVDAAAATFTSTSTAGVTVLPALASLSTTSPHCVGDNLVLTSTPFGVGTTHDIIGPDSFVYSMTNPSTSVTINSVTVAKAGTYTLTVTNTNSCTAVSTALVVISPTTVGGSITPSTATVCSGTNSTLLTLSGHVGDVQNWEWSIDGSTWTPVVNTSTTLTATNLNITTYYRAVVKSGSCTAAYSSTATITVNATPVPVITPSGVTTFCAGGSVDLVASGGSTYLWSTSATTASITVNTSNTYTVTVTTLGCSASTATVVTVNPLPTATITPSGSVSFCTGGNVILTAGSGTGYSYLWNNAMGTTQSITVTLAGSYTVTVTDGNLCSATSAATVVSIDPLSVGGTLTPTTAAVCTGTNSTLLTLQSATGTVQRWESSPDGLSWTTALTTTSTTYTATNLSTQTVYRAVVKSGECTEAYSGTATITINALPTPTITPSGATTFCVPGGSVDLVASGGISYLWSTSAVTASITVSTSGTYTVTVTDGNGCTASTATVVTANPTPTPVITPNGPTTFCAGGNVILTASGGSTYLWSTAATTDAITVSSTGTYTVTVTALGCSASTSTDVTVNALPVVAISAGGPTTFCQGGSVLLTATGGPSYLWTGGETTATKTVTVGGTYTVTVTDVNLCSASTSTVVTVNPNPVPVLVTNSPVCVGGIIGFTVYPQSAAYSLSAVGPNSYNHTFADPTYTDQISPAGLANMGTYTLTAVNIATTCSASVATYVTVNPIPVAGVSASPSATVCDGTNVTLTATGGSSYLWSTSATTSTITVTTSGTYSVAVTNLGCTTTTSILVTVNSNPISTISADGPLTFCQGDDVILTASAGSSWLWSNSATTQSITVTTSGTYTVTVTNSFGCTTVSAPTVVTVNALPIAAIAPSSPAFCLGGSVVLTASGGTSYLWSTTATTASITVSSTGTYTVTVTDVNSCSTTTSTVVTVNPLPTPVITPDGPTTFCFGLDVDLTASGGVSYVWSTGSTSPTITVTTSGTYTVTVTDINGCSATTSQVVIVHPLPVPAITSNSPLCENTTLNLNGFPQETGIIYDWAGPPTFTAHTVYPVYYTSIGSVGTINAGTYTLTVTDANSCSASTTTQVVISPASIGGSISGSTAQCTGVNSTTLTLSGITGTVVKWQSGPDGLTWPTDIANTTTTYTATNLTATTYYRAIVQSGICAAAISGTASVTINPLPVPVITPTGPTTVCEPNTVILTASGGTSYLWSTSATTASITVAGVSTGTYTVTVTDGNGCSASISTVVTINALPSATITASAESPVCSTGSVVLTAGSGSGYSYLWSGGATTQSITVTTTGTYTVTVTALGCSASTSTVVTFTPLPTATISYAGDPYCSNEGTATVTLNGTNAYTGGTFTASGGLTINSGNGDVTLGTPVGTFTVTYTIAAAGGCPEVVATTPITVTALPTISGFSYGGPFCTNQGIVTPSITVSSPATFSATPTGLILNTTNGVVTLEGSAAGIYTVLATIPAAGGCGVVTSTATIEVKTAPVADAHSNAPICVGSTLILTATAGADITTYTWSGPAAYSASSGANVVSLSPVNTLNAGTYTLVVTASNGCTDTDTTNVVIHTTTIGGTVAGSAAVCSNANSTVLTLSGQNGTVQRWESSPDGSTWGTATVTTSVTYTATNITATTWFRAIVQNGSCLPVASGTASITVTQLPTITAFSYAGTPYCSTSGPASVTLTGTNAYTGGTFTSSPTLAGLNASTGEVTVIGSTPGSYVITYATLETECPSVTATTTFTITLLPTVSISYGGTPYCESTGTAMVTRTGTGAYTVGTYSAPAGLSINATTGDVDLVASTPGTYTVTYTLPAAGGCGVVTAQASITLKDKPAPLLTANSPVCVGNTLILTGSSPIAITTYTFAGPASFGVVSAVNVTTLSPIGFANAGTYTLTVNAANGCSASTTTVVVVSVATVGGNVTGGVAVCSGTNSTLLTLSGQTGNVVRWESSVTGAAPWTPIANTATTYTATNLTVTTYFRAVVQSEGCTELPSSATTITVNPIPVASISANPGLTICSGSTVVLTASGGTTYLWSTGATTAAISVTTGGTYTVTATSLGCSNSTSVLVTVNPTPEATITASGSLSFCSTSSVTLTAGGGTSYLWSTGATTTSITVATSGTYTVTATALGCSNSTSVVVVVSQMPSGTISYATPNCNTGTAAVTSTVVSGGTYTSVPTGLSINASTGLVDLAGSVAGTYSVTYTVTVGTCPPYSTSAPITVTALPTITTFSYGGTYCSNLGIVTPTLVASSTSGTFTAVPTGLSLNSSTGEVDLGLSTPGTYTVTYTIAAAGGCPAVTKTAGITIIPAPVPVASSNSPVCQGGILTLTGTPTTGITTYAWIGPASFAHTGSVNVASLSPVSFGNTGTYTLTVTATNGCTAVTSTYVWVSPFTVGGTVSGAATVCTGVNSTTLTLNGQTGNVVRWESSLNGTTWGTATVTTATSYTATNLTATTHYRAIVKSGGCDEAASSSAIVTVSSQFAATISYATPFCSNSAPASVTLTGTPGGTFSALPSGLLINATTGTLTIATSTVGTYTVTYHIPASGGCLAVNATAPVTITQLPAATISYGSTPFCPATGTATVSQTGTTGGVYSAPAGLVINSATGLVNLATSTAGTYTVTYTIAAANGCGDVTAQAGITILPAAAPDFQSNSPVCTGTNLNLWSTTVATNYTFSGPGFFTTGINNNTTTGPVNSSNAGLYTLVVTYANLCTATSTLNIVISPLTVAGSVTGGATVCSGTNSTLLTLSGQTGTVQRWESSPDGTTWGTVSVTTSTTYTATNLSTTTHFRAVVKSGGCPEAASSAAIVTVTPMPVASISYASAPYCVTGLTAPVTLVGTPGGSYAATGGLTVNASTGTVNLTMAGTFTVTYTVAASGGCPVVTASTQITINAAPAATIAYAGSPYCSNGGFATAILTGTTGGVYSAAAGLTINPTTGIVTLATSTAGTYTVTYTIAPSGGCLEFVTTTQITITALPTASISYAGTPYCSNAGTASVTLVGNAGGTYTATGGLVINSSTGLVTIGAAGTYTVTYTIAAASGCPAVVATTNITVTQLPAATISYPATPYCSNLGTISVVRTGTAGGVYTAAPAGLAINSATGAVDLGASVPGDYTVTYTIAAASGCPVVTATAPITVKLAPAPTATSNSPVCVGGTLILTGTPATGITTYTWSGPGAFSSIGSVNTASLFPVSATNTGTYILMVTATNGCTAVTTTEVIISPLTVGGTVGPNATVCTGTNSTLLTLTGQVGTVEKWQYSLDGTTWTDIVNTAPTYTATDLTVTTLYRAIVKSGGCAEEASAAATITVSPYPTATISYATPVCTNGGTALPTFTGTTGGTYSGAPAGLTINPSTGAISLATSVPGTYTVTYTVSGAAGCSGVIITATAPITVTAAPTASIAYAANPYCSNGGTALVTQIGTTGGTYSAVPAGLSINALSGAVNLGTSVVGTYTVTYTIAAASGCDEVTATTPITILASPVPVATSNSPVCTGGTLILTGTPATGISNYSWVGPGFTSTGSVNTATLTPMTAGNAGTYYLTVTSTNGCTATTSTVVAIAPNTVGGTVGANQSICYNSVPANLVLSGNVGNVVKWQSAPLPFTTWTDINVTTTTLPGSTIGPLTVTTAFRAVVQSGTCPAVNSGMATIVVIPIPSAPVVTVVNNCGSSTLTASVYTGTLLWSNGATTASITVSTPGIYTVVQTVTPPGCTSLPGSGVAAPLTVPAAPVVTVVDFCGYSELTASGYTGTLLWSTGETTSSITVTTGGIYTVNQTVGGCVSPDGSGVAAPLAIPAAPVVVVSNECGNSVLTATGYTGTLLWSTGETTSSITVTVAGTYTVNQTVGTCTSPDGSGVAAPKAIPTAPVVTVVNNLGHSILTASAYTGTLLWSTGETTSSITVTVPGTYYVTQTVDGCTSPAGSGVAAPIESATIAGYVKYNNNYATGMNGVTVQLCTPGGTVISTAVTATSGGAGYYSFSGITAGSYRLKANFGGAWLGANATDANIVQQHVAGLLVPPLQFLRNTVADVNASGTISSLDAAMINQRFVGLITSFPAGDWKFTDTTFTLIGDVNIDLKALCVGDVNGSDIPTGAKESSFLNAVDDGVMTVPVNSTFTYEIRSNEIADLGAMSLIMNFDQTRFSVDKVNTSLEGLVYNITDGRIALAWSDTKALSLKNDETVISLQITAKETLTEAVQIFTIGGGSEFADASANRIENFDLKMTKVVTAAGDVNFFMYNYPNPFRNTTEIVYSIPEDGKVTLVLTNMYGQTIRTLVDETKAAGTYKVKVDLSDGYLKTGVYLYRIDVEGATNSYNKTNKMMLTR